MFKPHLQSSTVTPAMASGPPLNEEPGLGALTLSGFLRQVTTSYGSREALVMHSKNTVERWSYHELWSESRTVARALMASGVGKGTRVGIMMTNRPEWLTATFGTALCGATAVCLSTFSTAEELDHLLRVSGLSLLLYEPRVLNKDFTRILETLVPELATSTPGEILSPAYPWLRYVVATDGGGGGAVEPWAALLQRGSAVSDELLNAAEGTVAPSDPAAILFSSGSTSVPKGIINSHRGVAVQLWRWGRIYGMRPQDRTWTANGFFWSGNFVMAVGATLAYGGSIVLQPTFNAEEALQLLERERVTCPLAWPHQWAQLEAAKNWRHTDLGSIHHAESASPFHQHPTVDTDWVEPIGAYGCTETFTIVTSFPASTPRPHKGGAVLPGNTVKIVDPGSGKIVARGELGEISVKGATLMLGYLGIPLDETVDDEGFLRTGDSGYLDDDGLLFFEGRLSDIIKTGGANVSPLEVDKVISLCEGVKAVKTVGVPHRTLGEMVVACVVCHVNADLSAENIRDFAKTRLASYKVPRAVLFFAEDELALTSSNKIKSADLRRLAADCLVGMAH